MYHCSRSLFSALLVGATAVSIGCVDRALGDLPDTTENARPASVQPLAAGEPMRFHSGLTTRQRLVIRDAATWANVWHQIAGTIQPAPAVPVIDFATGLVIVAAMGTKSSGGYSIEVDDVHTIAGGASISVTEQSPGSGCAVTQAFTAPVAVVVVPRFSGQATFVEHSSLHACR
jgi:hypothetical protein